VEDNVNDRPTMLFGDWLPLHQLKRLVYEKGREVALAFFNGVIEKMA
jgi:hypothetical protein